MFYFFADLVGLPVDQVNYFICFLLSFPLSLVLRDYLGYKSTSVTIRNAYSGSLGILFCIVCFETSTVLLLLFAIGGYCILSLDRRVTQWYTVLYCYMIVWSFHLYRMIVDYGNYTLDLSFPMMVMMQRITYVGFGYHDGGSREDELNDDQKQNRIVAKPTIIEYFSYVFSYYSVLTGPTATYMDHNDMITGRNIERHITKDRPIVPSSLMVVGQKVAVGALCLLISLIIGSFDLDLLILDPSVAFPRRLACISIFCFALRCKYYFVWMTIESISNVNTLGFNGYDKSGNPKWDLVTNIDILGYELGTFYYRIIVFNKLTAIWLKRIVFERITFGSKNNKRLITFILSLLWHGFYPGYYLFYIAMLTGESASKKINSNILPYLQSSYVLSMLYNILVFIIRALYFDFFHLSFFYLVHDKIFIAWSYYYFIPFFLPIAIAFLLPNRKELKTQ